MNRKLSMVLFVAVGCLLGASKDAHAQASCTISATSVNFGNYNVFNGTAVDSTGTITFRCNSSAFNISVSLTDGAATTFNPRTMIKGAEKLNYNLYRNSARTTIWGDGTGGTQQYTNANPPNNSNVTLTVYGRVPAGQDVSAGAYSDTVTAVINF
jgi:spore coat protein U domain-containing protein, fimbrial subunit CupE1/2/3/6